MTITDREAPPLGVLDELAARVERIEQMWAEILTALGLEPPAPAPSGTVPLSEVPVDGTVEVRGVTFSGRFGPWMRVVGERVPPVGGAENRSLLMDGIAQPFTWHRDAHVQVRPARDQELRWENPR